jgi:hypothetical protein
MSFPARRVASASASAAAQDDAPATAAPAVAPRRPPCPNGPNCQELLERKCQLGHPMWHTPCRNGAGCPNRGKCHFGHPAPAAAAAAAPVVAAPAAAAPAAAVAAPTPESKRPAPRTPRPPRDESAPVAEPQKNHNRQERPPRPPREVRPATAPKQKLSTSTIPPPPTDLPEPPAGFTLVLRLMYGEWITIIEKIKP